MASNKHSLFASFGRAVDGFASAVAFARYVNHLNNTPETVFRSRGTSRDAAIRAALERF